MRRVNSPTLRAFYWVAVGLVAGALAVLVVTRGALRHEPRDAKPLQTLGS